jgi:hypothetical protein
VPFPKVHDLDVISRLDPTLSAALSRHRAALSQLTAYEAGCRYPPIIPVTREQAQEAVEWGESIRDAILPLLDTES